MNPLIQLYFHYALPIFTLLWIACIARSTLVWLHFIQLKQYRLDRLWEELKSPSFWRMFFSSYRSILIGFLVAWEVLLRANIPTPTGIFDVLFISLSAFFFLQVLLTAYKLKKRTLKLPTFTKKVWILFVLTLSLELLVGNVYQFWPEQLLVLEILQPFIVMVVFVIAFLPNLLLFEYSFQKARKKIQSHTNLITIGITGSYGKTTMKEYLAHLLSTKHRVLKTPEHTNVDTGIANLVLKQLNPDHQFFIVEMGAYRKGEIRRICDVVLPSYAVLTGLSNQHLSLFGSLADIERAKFELVEAVADEEKIFANADSQNLMTAFKNRSMSPQTFSILAKSDSQASQIRFEQGETFFTLNNNEYHAGILGRGTLTNLVGAIALAQKLGLTPNEIQAGLLSLPKLRSTMQTISYQKSTIIDDTYNANTIGVLAALDDLESLESKEKVVIFDHIIELGEETNQDHAKIAQKIAAVATHALIMPSPQQALILDELKKSGFDSSKILSSGDVKSLQALAEEDAIFLFEGRGSSKILTMLQKEIS